MRRLSWVLCAVGFLMVPVAARAQSTDELALGKLFLGSTGCLISTGSGAPSGGSSCDAYLDYATGIWYHKYGSTWVAVVDSSGNLLASKLTGTIPSAVLGNSSVYLGTTSIALNRASAALSVADLSVTGGGVWNAGAVTSSGGISGTTGTFSGDVSLTATAGTDHNLSIAGGDSLGRITVESATGDVVVRNLRHSLGGFRFTTRPGGVETTALSILNSGDVGIGTAAPLTNFVVAKSTNGIGLEVDVDTGYAGKVALYAYDRSAGYVPLIIPGGNVGIGTTGPLAKLAINGGLHVGGDSDPGNDNIAIDGGVASDWTPTTTDTYSLGRYDKLWKDGFVSTLNAIVFKESTATIFGGYSIIGKQAGAFAADVSAAATTIDFGQTMTPNDWLLVRAHDTGGTVKAEYLQVGTLVSGTTYNVTRDLAGSHVTDPAWAGGTPFLVEGTTGDGRIEMLAYDGHPRTVYLQQGAAANTITERAVVGNLNGYYGYASDLYGFAAGDSAATWIKVDPTNGVRIGNGATTKISLDAAGNASFAGALDAATGSFSGAVTSTSGTIGGWTIGATTLSSSGIALYAAPDAKVQVSGGANLAGLIAGSSGSDVGIFAGGSTPASAPFRVTLGGDVFATSGTIGGWTLGASSLTGGNATLASSGNLTLGTSNDVLRGSADDATYRLWIGHATAASAPFRVSKAGAVTMTSATITTPDITLGSAGTYDTSSALKFQRGVGESGTGSRAALYNVDDGGNQNLKLENTVVSESGLDRTATVDLVATGYVGTPTNAATTASYISVSSGPSTNTKILYNSDAHIFNTGIRERSRTTALGEWTAVAYNSANYTASAGTWTVDSGDQVTYSYTLVGKTLTLVFFIQTTDVSSAAALRIAIPDGYTAAKATRNPCQIFDAGTVGEGLAYVAAGGTYVSIGSGIAGNNFGVTSADNTYVIGQIVFEIQ